MTDKRGPGRPSSANPQKQRTFMRWSDLEVEELKRRAALAGMKVTDYVKSRTIGGN